MYLCRYIYFLIRVQWVILFTFIFQKANQAITEQNSGTELFTLLAGHVHDQDPDQGKTKSEGILHIDQGQARG